jgi:hypothetical protein
MRKYSIFIDENFPKQLAKGINLLIQKQNQRDNLDIEVISLEEHFGAGILDEDWIPKIGELGGIVITQDYRIQSQKHQRELYLKHGVSILFFNPPSKSGFLYWEMVKQIVNRWEEITHILKKNKPPFAFRCSSRADFEKIN